MKTGKIEVHCEYGIEKIGLCLIIENNIVVKVESSINVKLREFAFVKEE